MLRWLNGDKNTVRSPNENYAREMMELFTLGANRGYTEQDIREQARALTGWRGVRRPAEGTYDFSYVPRLHDAGVKTVFGKSGDFDWQDACRLCREHPNHPSFFVSKLWSYFIPTAPPAATQRALEALYRNGYQVRPVVEAILQHPALYTGPRMVKPPVVYAAGLLRALGRGVQDANWANLSAEAGPASLSPSERRGLGRQAVARHVDLPRPLVRRRDGPARVDVTQHRTQRSCARRPRRLGTRCPHADEAHAYGRDPPRAGHVEVEHAGSRGAGRPAAARALAGGPDLVTRRACACDDFGRAHAVAGRRPAGDRARNACAGGNRTDASQLPREGARRRADRVRPRPAERPRHRRARQRGDEQPRARLGLPRRRSGLAVDALPGSGPALLPVPPDARAPPVLGIGVRRGRPAALASVPDLARAAARRRQGQRDPGDRLHEPGQVALHLTALLGGRRDGRGARTGWLGRYLDRVGSADNPLQGLSLDSRLQPALATGKVPVASIDGPDRYTFAARRDATALETADPRCGRGARRRPPRES